MSAKNMGQFWKGRMAILKELSVMTKSGKGKNSQRVELRTIHLVIHYVKQDVTICIHSWWQTASAADQDPRRRNIGRHWETRKSGIMACGWTGKW